MRAPAYNNDLVAVEVSVLLVHLGLFGELIQDTERVWVALVLLLQLMDASFHRAVEVIPPGLVRQREMIDEGEVAVLDLDSRRV